MAAEPPFAAAPEYRNFGHELLHMIVHEGAARASYTTQSSQQCSTACRWRAPAVVHAASTRSSGDPSAKNGSGPLSRWAITRERNTNEPVKYPSKIAVLRTLLLTTSHTRPRDCSPVES